MVNKIKNRIITPLNTDYVSMVVFFALSLAFMVNSPFHPWRRTLSLTDSSVFQTIAMMMRRGYTPYKDTFDHKGPLIYLINYLGLCINESFGIWIIEVISLAVSFFVIFKIARLYCGLLSSYVIVALSGSILAETFESGNLVEEYALPYISIATFIFIDYLTNNVLSKKRLVIVGVCLGAVLMLRPNMIALWIVFCLGILIKLIKSKEMKVIKECVIYVLLGILLFVSPIVIWLMIHHAFNDFIEAYLLFNFAYSSKYGDSVDSKVSAFLFFLNFRLILICFILQLCETLRRRRLIDIIILIYMILSLLFVSISGASFAHYGMVLVPVVVLPLAFVLEELELYAKRNKAGILVSVVSSVLLVTYCAPYLTNIVKSYSSARANDAVTIEPETTIVNVIQTYTEDNDAISVYGNYDRIYVLSKRQHATRYSYQYPIGDIDEDIIDDYFESLAIEQPKIIVVQAAHFDDRIIAFLEDYGYSECWVDTDNSWTRVYVKI